MAKFLKVVSTDATNPEVLIGIDQITHVKRDVANPDSEIEIVYGAATCTITFTGGAGVAVDVLKAFNSALTANPGGIVSTVGSPLVSAQTFVGGAIDGRMLIDNAAVYVTYTDVVFA
tara:strand:+ start:241 stop:591 length:351 start_codon:yes stop_codon:yes gene_type:complete